MRSLAPFRGAHFVRPRAFTPFLTTFERDPFFREFAPLFNTEFSHFQRFRPRWQESSKAYRLELDVPGFRKDEISMDLLESGRLVRITGERHRGRTTSTTEGERIDPQSKLPDQAEGQATAPTEAAQPHESATTTESAVVEAQPKEADAMNVEDKGGIVDSERESFSVDHYIPEDADTEAVRASLDHGILSIVFPKSKVEAPRKITIE